jgi:hypothetical protein
MNEHQDKSDMQKQQNNAFRNQVFSKLEYRAG